MDDRDIIELFWQRDERAIEETAKTYGGLCFHIAYGILASQEDSEECVNDAYQKLWESIPPHRPDHLKLYLGRIIRNLAINRWNAEHTGKRDAGIKTLLDELEEALSSPQTVEREWESREISEEISHWLRRLKAEDRRLFIRRYWYDLSLNDLASEYGVRPQRLAQKMHRLRKSLKKHLEERGIAL